jgi:glucosyl-3-phosphoglycerate synthase
MPDFFQTGVVTTLHLLKDHDSDRFSRELRGGSWNRVTLLLPCLVSDFRGPAMEKILPELAKAGYLSRLIFVLGNANAADYLDVSEALKKLPYPCHILWLESPRISNFMKGLQEAGLYVANSGKGRAVWMGFGLANAKDRQGVVAMHDCDIVTYKLQMLDRLCYPAASPEFGYEFVKGYYARVGKQLNGRVVRLFFTPLVRSLKEMVGQHPFLNFVDSFRYPLSGECALTTEIARRMRIPSDWGLEIGFLSEVYRLCAPTRVCDVDLMDDPYDHKHQPLDSKDTGGLRRMASEIARSIFRTLAIEAVPIEDGMLRSLRVAYMRLAQDYISRYAHAARIDSIPYDRHEEGTAVDLFTQALSDAIEQFRAEPLSGVQLPNWARVISAMPDGLSQLSDAVEKDAEEYGGVKPREASSR